MNPTVLKLEELKCGTNAKVSGCLSVGTMYVNHPCGTASYGEFGFPAQLHTEGDLWFRYSQPTGTDAFPFLEGSFSVLPIF